jgi:type 1 glutamine amidotransferase
MVVGVFSCWLASFPSFGADKLRVLIIDGQNNHNWVATTPVLKAALEKCGRFTMDVSTTPLAPPRAPAVPKGKLTPEQKAAHDKAVAAWKEKKAEQEKAAAEQWKTWRPKFADYAAVISNYNGELWPEPVCKAFEEYVRNGGGLVVFHAANNAFPQWPEWNLMIGLGWRGNTFGDRVTVDDQGNIVRTPKGEGPGAGHGPQHEYQVRIRDREHPITKGLPGVWLHPKDELYQGQRGPAKGMHILATAFAAPEQRGTGAHEPMLWVIPYGKGRCFTTLLGHDEKSSCCVGFQVTLCRGTEWAATGKVTLPVPANFPTATQVKLAE